jgi:hypothetical protein
MNRRRAQVWYIDFMVGLLILITSLFIYYQYQGNLLDQSDVEWQEMIIDSKAITSSLISAGYPTNWTNETVEVIGLTDGDYRLNTTKVMLFRNISYKRARELLKTRFNFYFFVQDENGTKFYDAGLNETDPSFLVQTTRFVIYNSSLHRMVLHLWVA